MAGIETTLRAATTAAAVVALLSIGVLCDRASAATVEEREDAAANRALLEIRDDAGENNELEIRLAGESGAYYEFQVKDYVASVAPGPGCASGGEASVVTCMVHKPSGGWSTSLLIYLGGGERNFCEASQLLLHPNLPITAFGGPGEDALVGGGGNDVFDPGGGRDWFYGNPGNDEFLAPAIPDEGDVYDGGEGDDLVSYARRSQPVRLSGSNVEAATGSDQMIGVEFLRGGSGDDMLVDGPLAGSYPVPNFARLEGGPGDDLLEAHISGGTKIGGPGNDLLVGGDDIPQPPGLKGGPIRATNFLIGEKGNDTYIGGHAKDVIREFEPGAAVADPGSADFARGSWRGDLIELGAGEDIAYGDGGNDRINGGTGRDLLLGGDQNDLLIGDAGSDRIFGGSGRDRLFAARKVVLGAPHPLTSGPYDGRDLVGCGRGLDLAFANPWDSRRSCERLVLQPRPRDR